MKRTVLFLLAAAALAAAGAVGWWLRGHHAVDYFSLSGDFVATGIEYSARAYEETNRELEIQLRDAHLPSNRSGNARCFVVPKGGGPFEIVYYSGDPKTPGFPPQLQDQLGDFALERLAQITAEDQCNSTR